MKVLATLNPNEGGCDYSKYFKETWINNDKLHPAVKEIEVQTLATSNEPEVAIFDKGEIILTQKGSQINSAILQEFILEYLGLSGKQTADQ